MSTILRRNPDHLKIKMTGGVRTRSMKGAQTPARTTKEVEISNMFDSLLIEDSQDDLIESSQQIASRYLEDPDDENLQAATPKKPQSLNENEEEKENVAAATIEDDDKSSLQTSLEFTQAQLEDFKKENQGLMQYLNDLDLDSQRSKYAINKLEAKQGRLEYIAKRKNLVLEGLDEAEGGREDIHDVISRLFQVLGLERQIDYDLAHRVGPFLPRRRRPILIGFCRTDDRDLVYSLRSSLKTTDNHFNVWISEDVSAEARRERTVMKQVAMKAKENGLRATTSAHALVIDSRKYEAGALDRLPKDLSLEKVKTKYIFDAKRGEEIIGYHSEHSPFSNLFHCSIFVGKREFLSVEQILQYKRAQQLNRKDIANKILLSWDSYEIRQLGEEAGTSEEWEAREEAVMYAAILRKFHQDLELLMKLLATGNKMLVETTPDKKWGAGAALNSKLMRSGEWKGENKQGIILMKARDQLRRENPEL